MTTTLDLAVGDDLPPIRRRMTRERMRWYADALVATSEPGDVPRLAGANIHTDDEFARSQGLPGIISDGMISTNWLSSILLHVFEEDYLRTGRLRTKYIKPIFEDCMITARARVREVVPEGDGVRYELDVWCEDDAQVVYTVGDATVTVAR